MPLNVSGSDSLYWQTGLNLRGLQRDTIAAKGILSGFMKQVSAMDIFAGLGIGAVIAFTKMSKEAYKFAKEFENAMLEVKTISKSVQQDFRGMEQAMINMSKRLPDGLVKLTQGLYQVVSAGYDGRAALEIVEQASKLATAGLTDTKTAAEAVVYTLNAFGSAAGTVDGISDKLFKTVELGIVKMEELAPAVAQVAGMWAQAGGSYNDLMATFATGLKRLPVQEMTTGIRGILSAIIKPTPEAQKVLKQLGVDFSTTAMEAEGFYKMMQKLRIAVGNDASAMNKLADVFPNIRGLLGVTSLKADDFTEALNAMATSAGATEKAFQTMVTSTDNQIRIFANNIKTKLLPLGQALSGAFGGVLRVLNEQLMGEQPEPSKQWRGMGGLPRVKPKPAGEAVPDVPTAEAVTGMDEAELDALYERLVMQYGDYKQKQAAIDKKYSELKREAKEHEVLEFLKLDEQYALAALMIEEGLLDVSVERRKEMHTENLKNFDEALKNEKNLREELLRDINKMNVRELLNYRQFLKDKLDVFKADNAMREYILEKIDVLNNTIYNKEIEQLENIAKLYWSIADAASTVSREQLSGIRNLGEIADAIADLGESYGKEDWVGVLTSVVRIATEIADMFSKADEAFSAWQERMAHTRDMVQQIANLREMAYGQKQIDYLRQELRLLQEMINAYNFNLMGTNVFNTTDLNVLIEAMDGLLALYKDADITKEALQNDLETINMIYDRIVQLQKMLTGTTSDSIIDALVEGFKEGKSTAADFADTFEELMTGALMEAFKREAMMRYVQDWYELFAQLSEGGLTQEEMQLLKYTWTNVIKGAQEQWQAFIDLAKDMGLDIAGGLEPEGLKGAIKGITEETAGLLAGQFHNLILDTEEIKMYTASLGPSVQSMAGSLESIVVINSEIAANTRYNRLIYAEVQRMNRGGGTGRNYLRAVGG